MARIISSFENLKNLNFDLIGIKKDIKLQKYFIIGNFHIIGS